MKKIKNNIFILAITTFFLFVSCLVVNIFSNKYSVKADEINQQEIYTSANEDIFLCGIIDPANDEHGYILFNYEIIIELDTVYFNYGCDFFTQTLNFNSTSYSYNIINSSTYTQTKRYTINEIRAILMNFYPDFDYSQYPIDSARDYTNIELEVELEYELFNGDFDYYYMNIEIPINEYFDNPNVFNLCDHSSYLKYNVELAYEQGYTRGYRDGLSNNNENLGQAYEQGYEDGYKDSSLDPSDFLTSIFSGVNEIFNVEIFPNFKLWYLIGAPLIVAVIIAILKFLR